jgi:hypothetical protein
VEDQLLALAPYIKKVACRQQQQRTAAREESLACLDIGLDTCRKWTVPLMSDDPRMTLGAAGAVTEDWQNLGGGGGPATDSAAKKMSTAGNIISETGGGQLVADSDGQVATAPCKKSLDQLLVEKRRECAIQMAYRDSLRQEGGRAGAGGTARRPRGVLVAHLTEHKGAVTGLVAVPETTLLASTSADGTLRIWDCTKMEGRNIANKVGYSIHFYENIAVGKLNGQFHFQ